MEDIVTESAAKGMEKPLVIGSMVVPEQVMASMVVDVAVEMHVCCPPTQLQP